MNARTKYTKIILKLHMNARTKYTKHEHCIGCEYMYVYQCIHSATPLFLDKLSFYG